MSHGSPVLWKPANHNFGDQGVFAFSKCVTSRIPKYRGVVLLFVWEKFVLISICEQSIWNLQTVDDYVTYILYKFQIDSSQIEISFHFVNILRKILHNIFLIFLQIIFSRIFCWPPYYLFYCLCFRSPLIGQCRLCWKESLLPSEKHKTNFP